MKDCRFEGGESMTLPTMLLIVSFVCSALFVAMIVAEAPPKTLIPIGVAIVFDTVLAIAMML